MNREIVIIIKVILAILLLLCLVDFPYGYYQFVRFVSMVGFGFLGYWYFQNSNQLFGISFIILAILFQPFFKIHLGRELWNVVDVIVAIGLIILIFYNPLRNKTE